MSKTIATYNMVVGVIMMIVAVLLMLFPADAFAEPAYLPFLVGGGVLAFGAYRFQRSLKAMRDGDAGKNKKK